MKFSIFMLIASTLSLTVNAVPLGGSLNALEKRRFGQEHTPQADKTFQDVKDIAQGSRFEAEAGNLSGAMVRALLAKAPACEQQNQADNVIDLGKNFGGDKLNQMIKVAQTYRQLERNTPNAGQPSELCTTPPRNKELDGLTQAQDPTGNGGNNGGNGGNGGNNGGNTGNNGNNGGDSRNGGNNGATTTCTMNMANATPPPQNNDKGKKNGGKNGGNGGNGGNDVNNGNNGASTTCTMNMANATPPPNSGNGGNGGNGGNDVNGGNGGNNGTTGGDSGNGGNNGATTTCPMNMPNTTPPPKDNGKGKKNAKDNKNQDAAKKSKKGKKKDKGKKNKKNGKGKKNQDPTGTNPTGAANGTSQDNGANPTGTQDNTSNPTGTQDNTPNPTGTQDNTANPAGNSGADPNVNPAEANPLGGVQMPKIQKNNGAFIVNGDRFVNEAAAHTRQCDVQHNLCANKVNGGDRSFTLGDCDTQNNTCKDGPSVFA